MVDYFDVESFGNDDDVKRSDVEHIGVCCICGKNTIVNHIIGAEYNGNIINDDVCDDCITKLTLIL